MRLEDILSEEFPDMKEFSDTLSDLSPYGIVVFSEGTMKYANPAVERISGYTKQELIGLPLDRLMYDFRSSPTKSQTIKIRRKDGEERMLEVWSRELKSNYLFFLQDNTTWLRTEQALHEEENRFRELVELLPETVFEINLHRQVSFVNKKGLELFGYDSSEAVSIYDLFPQEEHKRLDRNIEYGLRRKVSLNQEYTAKRKDGSLFPVEVSSTPIYRKSQPLGIRGILSDIAERKSYEEALEKSEKRLSTIIEAIAIPTFVINDSHIVTHWNSACEHITGISKERIIGTADHPLPFYGVGQSILADMVVEGKTLEEISSKYPHIEEDKGSYAGEDYFNLLRRWLYFTSTPLKEGENITGAVETIQDVTEQRNATRSTRNMLEAMVRSQGRTAEIFDTDTGDHTRRIGLYCCKIAEFLGMDEEYQESIGLQAQLHDIGKVHIPYEIINKPGELTKEEFDTMKDHTIYGAIILRGSREFALAKQIAHFHHERYDGSGYPDGLVGEEIPLSARITKIADVFDALVTKRVYKKAYSYEEAYEIMTKGDNRIDPQKHFDPNILAIFCENYSEFTLIHQENFEEESHSCLELMVLEDEKQLQDLLGEYFSSFNYVKLYQAESIMESHKILSEGVSPEIVFVDITLPDGSGHDLAKELRRYHPESYLICTTGHSFVEESILYDQILHKPYSLDKVGKIVELFGRYR